MASSRGAPVPGLGFLGSLAIFGAAALLFYGLTEGLLPALASASTVEPVVLWFLVAGFLFFSALLICAWYLLRAEGIRGRAELWSRLRFTAMSKTDWGWTLAGLGAIGSASVALLAVVTSGDATQLAQPWFLEMKPVGPGRWWILALWLPFFVLAIFSEEILWRGVLLPRQEAALGRWAWAANGAGWLLMHLAFGGQILAMLLPIVVVLPFVAQRTRNTWPAVLIHAAFNGPGFLANAFGWV